MSVEDYLKNLEKVEGWTRLGACQLFLAIDECQEHFGISKDYFEIGVHHGRSAILLGLMAKMRNKQVSVCDLFDNQERNISKSGKGNRRIFEENYTKWVGNLENLTIYECNSSDLSNFNLERKFGLFHIDGGHTKEETLNDLNVATRYLASGGTIIIDDAFNYRFPGVSEGLNNFFTSNSKYASLLIGKNKVVICNKDVKNEYFRYLQNEKWERVRELKQSSESMSKQKYYGQGVLIYGKRR